MDEASNDFRLISVPARDWPTSALRPVYEEAEPYPRHVGSQVSPSYAALPGQNQSRPIGHIPQVAHTYARYEASYASMNEMGVSITESTCGAKTVGRPVSQGGKALFWIGELSQVALERCATAKCAVQTMGDLGVQHGFYGEAEAEGAGESLLVAGPTEAWVFHILSSPDGASAVWAARRVPDDHATLVANMFTIRQMNLTDSANFLASPNLHDIAKAQGWWDPAQGTFDFTAAYSSGEYGHAYYSGRRMWRALSLLAPSLDLNATDGVLTDEETYPWSVRPEHPVSETFLFKLNRDHYEGTPYDLTKGMASGPFSSPDRWDGGSRFFPQPHGAFERAISMPRTSYSLVLSARPPTSKVHPTAGGVLWYGPHSPHATCYVPFFAAAAGEVDAVAAPYCSGKQQAVDRTTAWWATNLVFNWMDRMYRFMRPQVQRDQDRYEAAGAALVTALDQEARKCAADRDSLESCTAKLKTQAVAEGGAHAKEVAARWAALSDELILMYNDGYQNTPSVGQTIGYPEWWLTQVGYSKFPKPPPAEECSPQLE